MRKTMSVLGGALLLSLAGSGQAHAAEAVDAAGCTATYAGALASDVLVNGPVHVGGGGGIASVGPFTPSVFVAGAVTPTSTYVGCM